jgi:hypothetical protein
MPPKTPGFEKHPSSQSTGLFAADRYVVPDQIESVSGGCVVFRATHDELLKR